MRGTAGTGGVPGCDRGSRHGRRADVRSASDAWAPRGQGPGASARGTGLGAGAGTDRRGGDPAGGYHPQSLPFRPSFHVSALHGPSGASPRGSGAVPALVASPRLPWARGPGKGPRGAGRSGRREG